MEASSGLVWTPHPANPQLYIFLCFHISLPERYHLWQAFFFSMYCFAECPSERMQQCPMSLRAASNNSPMLSVRFTLVS